MIFNPTAMCKWCEIEIMLVRGRWVDRTIEEGASVEFAAACGEGSEYHQPFDDA